MPRLQEHAFTFTNHALPEDTFTVVRFSGEERLSTMYSFDILLVSEHDDLDLSAVLQNPATLTIKGATIPNITLSRGDANSWSSPAIPSIPDAAGLGGDLPYHGILSAFEQLHQADGHVFSAPTSTSST